MQHEVTLNILNFNLVNIHRVGNLMPCDKQCFIQIKCHTVHVCPNKKQVSQIVGANYHDIISVHCLVSQISADYYLFEDKSLPMISSQPNQLQRDGLSVEPLVGSN